MVKGPHPTVALPRTPPEDPIANFIYSAFEMSCPESRCNCKWLFFTAALRAHGPLPLCGSEKSKRTLILCFMWSCRTPRLMVALWYHPSLFCLKLNDFNSGIVHFNFLMTSSMIANKYKLSWLLLWETWKRVKVCRVLPACFLIATLKCQKIPRLPNRSAWFSLYFLGINFNAQSSTTNTEVSSKTLRISRWAASWLTERIMWAF